MPKFYPEYLLKSLPRLLTDPQSRGDLLRSLTSLEIFIASFKSKLLSSEEDFTSEVDSIAGAVYFLARSCEKDLDKDGGEI